MMDNERILSEMERRKYLEYLKSSGLENSDIKNAGLNEYGGAMAKPVYQELQKVPVLDQLDFVKQQIMQNKQEDESGDIRQMNDEAKKRQWMLNQYLEELHGKNQDLS